MPTHLTHLVNTCAPKHNHIQHEALSWFLHVVILIVPALQKHFGPGSTDQWNPQLPPLSLGTQITWLNLGSADVPSHPTVTEAQTRGLWADPEHLLQPRLFPWWEHCPTRRCADLPGFKPCSAWARSSFITSVFHHIWAESKPRYGSVPTPEQMQSTSQELQHLLG